MPSPSPSVLVCLTMVNVLMLMAAASAVGLRSTAVEPQAVTGATPDLVTSRTLLGALNQGASSAPKDTPPAFNFRSVLNNEVEPDSISFAIPKHSAVSAKAPPTPIKAAPNSGVATKKLPGDKDPNYSATDTSPATNTINGKEPKSKDTPNTDKEGSEDSKDTNKPPFGGFIPTQKPLPPLVSVGIGCKECGSWQKIMVEKKRLAGYSEKERELRNQSRQVLRAEKRFDRANQKTIATQLRLKLRAKQAKARLALKKQVQWQLRKAQERVKSGFKTAMNNVKRAEAGALAAIASAPADQRAMMKAKWERKKAKMLIKIHKDKADAQKAFERASARAKALQAKEKAIQDKENAEDAAARKRERVATRRRRERGSRRRSLERENEADARKNDKALQAKFKSVRANMKKQQLHANLRQVQLVQRERRKLAARDKLSKANLKKFRAKMVRRTIRLEKRRTARANARGQKAYMRAEKAARRARRARKLKKQHDKVKRKEKRLRKQIQALRRKKALSKKRLKLKRVQEEGGKLKLGALKHAEKQFKLLKMQKLRQKIKNKMYLRAEKKIETAMDIKKGRKKIEDAAWVRRGVRKVGERIARKKRAVKRRIVRAKKTASVRAKAILRGEKRVKRTVRLQLKDAHEDGRKKYRDAKRKMKLNDMRVTFDKKLKRYIKTKKRIIKAARQHARLKDARIRYVKAKRSENDAIRRMFKREDDNDKGQKLQKWIKRHHKRVVDSRAARQRSRRKRRLQRIEQKEADKEIRDEIRLRKRKQAMRTVQRRKEMVDLLKEQKRDVRWAKKECAKEIPHKERYPATIYRDVFKTKKKPIYKWVQERFKRAHKVCHRPKDCRVHCETKFGSKQCKNKCTEGKRVCKTEFKWHVRNKRTIIGYEKVKVKVGKKKTRVWRTRWVYRNSC